ncbi:MAG: hypothetical protein E7529_05845 [Ruminococcaceae bacterium]|nr:hypothetical protein [Oscillospiraceae bacterium]
MDTKLKNSKYHPLIKLVAVLLTIIFAFFTGVNALSYLRKAVFYADTTNDIKSTPAFANEIRNTVRDISALKEATEIYEEDLSEKEYLKTDKAKKIIEEYNQKEERAVKLFNVIQELKKLRPDIIETKNGIYEIEENGYVYFDEIEDYVDATVFYDYYNDYYYEGEYSEQVTYVVYNDEYDNDIILPTNDEELFALKDEYKSFSDWNYKYQQLRTAIFNIVDNAINEEQIRDDIQFEAKEYLHESYYEDFVENTARLNELKNVKFILKNNKSGKSISNVEKADRKDFIKNLDYNDIFHIEFDGKNLFSQPNPINRSTNLLKFLSETGFLADTSLTESYLLDYFKGYSLYLKIGGETLVPAEGDAYYQIVQTYNSLSDTDCDTYLYFTIIFAVLSLICFVGCCIISGRQKDGSVKLAFNDKVPFVLYLAFTVALVGAVGFGVGTLAFIDFFPEEIRQQYPGLQWLLTPAFIRNAIGLGFALITLFLLSFVLYIVRNVKAKALGNRFITIFLIRKIKSGIKKAKEKAKSKATEKELSPEQIKRRIKTQTILFFVGYVAINVFFYLFAFGSLFPISIIGLVIFNSSALVYALLYVSDVVRLAKVAEEIRNGNYKTVINTKNYIKPLRPFASDLSACRDGIENAINEAIKGEHLKTELITNVSHDLKTPLTSIINYVSLLKMGNIEGEEERKYIEILDKKSKKLKRLIEDLTEASKANSGNIKMNVAQVNLNEMALQAVGENSDVLENAGLDVILTERDKGIIVSADSQHTFRIIDNLFSNAKKYSLAGTRVYVDVYKENDYGVFEIKNISRDKLNIDPDELTERFVRGDNSRTTDGSGLGLSIARSFAELQNGIFNIEIDGDMFKAVVKLPLK